MSSQWIETDYRFPERDQTAVSYFEDADEGYDLIEPYALESIPQFKALLRERLGGKLTEQGILEIAVKTFRSKPAHGPEKQLPSDRVIADFIYQF